MASSSSTSMSISSQITPKSSHATCQPSTPNSRPIPSRPRPQRPCLKSHSTSSLPKFARARNEIDCFVKSMYGYQEPSSPTSLSSASTEIVLSTSVTNTQDEAPDRPSKLERSRSLKHVVFCSVDEVEVHEADEWDRTAVVPSKNLSIQEIIELEAIQRSLPHAHQLPGHDPYTGKPLVASGMGGSLPQNTYLPRVQLCLLPLTDATE